LKEEIFGKIINQMPILSNFFSQEMLSEIISIMEECFFSKEEIIYQQDDNQD
jgi:hypothetical protein